MDIFYLFQIIIAEKGVAPMRVTIYTKRKDKRAISLNTIKRKKIPEQRRFL